MTDDDPTPRKRGRPRLFEREEVLDTAMVHYWREGVHALSLNEVCRRVEVSKPSIYREFGGEDGLVEAVLGHYRDAVVVPVMAFVSGARPLAETLEGLVIGMTATGEHPPGCLFTEMRLLRSGLGPKTTARLDAIEAERNAALEALYARALERGEAKTAISPEGAAQFMDAQFSMELLHMGMGQAPERVRAQARLAFEVFSPTRRAPPDARRTGPPGP